MTGLQEGDCPTLAYLSVVMIPPRLTLGGDLRWLRSVRTGFAEGHGPAFSQVSVLLKQVRLRHPVTC